MAAGGNQQSQICDNNPSGASRQLPLHKGALEVHRQKYNENG